MATVLAAPMGATLCADHGADIVKPELPDGSDALRGLQPVKDGIPLWWKIANRGKRLPAPCVVPRIVGRENPIPRTGPSVGEHNAEVYAEFGIDAAELAVLREAKVFCSANQ